MEDEYIRVGEAARILKLTPQTVRKYRKEGKLNGYPTPGGQILYSKNEIEQYLRSLGGEPKKQKGGQVVHYARSSTGSKKSLESQLQKLREKYGEADYEIKDRSSGLNENRPGLRKMIELAKKRKISAIRITQKDRLSRFGNAYLKELFGAYDVEIVEAFDTPDKSLNEELMEDFMSLIASFSGKFYRLRGYKERKKLLETALRKLEENDDSDDGDEN